MNPAELDPTVILFSRYFDQATEGLDLMNQEYDENSVIDTIRTHTSGWDKCWFNAYQNTRPVGFIAGYLSETPWNKGIVLANIMFIYLLPEHRNMDNFNELLKEFESWAQLCEAKQICAGDIGINNQEYQTLYEHFDFKRQLFMTKDLV
jgi:hypothetical protein